jgi:hypothetical protein
MTITYDLDLANFGAWSGAKDTLETIVNNDLTSEVEQLLEELYPNGMTETELNDLLWFESEWIFDSIGFSEEEEEEEDN